jgi:dCTP deaminase
MIITDGALQQLLNQPTDPLLTEFDASTPTKWNDKDSLVQPCSLDLHIGEIFQPGIKPGKAGSAGNPKSELVLRTGQTAIVATKESIHLPADYAGLGFPPSHVSEKGLLMTNPGHVDPGYKGKLKFTVINMGRGDFVLRSKDPIVTMLIFKLDTKVVADYRKRRASPPPTSPPARKSVWRQLGDLLGIRTDPPTSTIAQAKIDLLSPDFIDVEKRAKRIAKKAVTGAGILGSVLAIILTVAVNAIEKRSDGIDEMKSRLTRVENMNTSLAKELQDTKAQLEKQMEIDHRLQTIELQSKPKGAPK